MQDSTIRMALVLTFTAAIAWIFQAPETLYLLLLLILAREKKQQPVQPDDTQQMLERIHKFYIHDFHKLNKQSKDN